MIFEPPCHPPRGTHISASRAHIKNRLDESANLAQRGIHAKFQPNSTSRLARAMRGGSIFDLALYNWRMSVYKSLKKQTKKMIRNKKNGLERRVAKEAKEDPKMFYAYVNSAKRTRSKIGPLKSEDGETVVDPEEQATILNNFFSSVFTRNEEPPTPKVCIAGSYEICEVVFTKEKVLRMIEGLKERSTPGPDQIPNKLLRETKNEIADALKILYTRCMEESRIPDEWRDAHITPIYKKGKRTDPENYRPVNLTSGVCKGMEIVIKEETDTFLETNNLIKNSQHGFRRRT